MDTKSDAKWVGIAFIGAVVMTFMNVFISFAAFNEITEVKKEVQELQSTQQDTIIPTSCTVKRGSSWFGAVSNEVTECQNGT